MQLIEDRRALHRIPELGKELPRTMHYLRQTLAPLNCHCFSPAEGALCAYFDFGAANCIAFRSDADALPITEHTGLPFASEIPGHMHACGHDAHMAMLLELARRLDQGSVCKNNILLVFQPAEESGGGARDIVESGVFDEYGVSAIFGLHLWPDLPAGLIASRKNEMMSRSTELHVDIWGRASHIAEAERGVDALAAGVAFYTRVMALVDALPAPVYRLCKFGRMESGQICNAISSHTHMEGSLRAFQDEVFFSLLTDIRTIGREIEQAYGCRVEIQNTEGYPAVLNPPALFLYIQSLGIAFDLLEKPVMITEDFSYYQRALPGLFFFLGTGPSPALHADDFHFDESVLQHGVAFFHAIAERY